MRLKKYVSVLILIISLCTSIMVFAAPKDDIMTRQEDGTYIIDTTTLCEEISGYRGATPIKVYIKDDKVVRVEYLPNQETPRFFTRLRGGFQDLWNGLKVKEAISLEPDAYTGATYSAASITENIRQALEYYQTHKRK